MSKAIININDQNCHPLVMNFDLNGSGGKSCKKSDKLKIYMK